MKTEYLIRYGLPESLVRRWSADNIRTLLPIQESSVIRFGILDSKSVVICGPGTSGKTFCGELGALARVSSRGRAIFLEPLKAVAEEKYRAFSSRYTPLGIKTVLSTRDHTAHDRDIFLKTFDIAILIYEKFNCLTSSDISLIKSASCFVIDEFQMISDPARGIELELAIMKIRHFNPQAQIILLMGSGSSSGSVSEWLGIPALVESHRPVELRLGVLRRGRFRFREFNHKAEGDEQWLEKIEAAEPGHLSAQTLDAIRFLISKGEQIIIFTRSRNISMALAAELSGRLELPSAEKALTALAHSPPSIQNDTLAKCLRKGVAFHHADLDESQRRLIEDGFRRGEIRILSSTSTLAVGVNLPAKNVFIETMKYSGAGSAGIVPLSGIDFHQAAGRAGRYGHQQAFGRAIMAADTPFEEEILWDKYVYSQSEEPSAGLCPDNIPDLALQAVACRIACDPDQLTKICERTYAGHRGAFGEKVSTIVGQALVQFEKSGLVTIKNWGRIEMTPAGRAAASSGLCARSAIEVIGHISSRHCRTFYDWLAVAVGLREWQRECGRYNLASKSPVALSGGIYQILGDETVYSSPVFCRLIENAAGMKMKSELASLLFAVEWCSGHPTFEMERFFGRGAGGLKRDSATLAWIISSIARLARAIVSDNVIPPSLERFAERLRYGVDEKYIPLARELDIDREFIARLVSIGVDSPECLMSSDMSALSAVVPLSVCNKIAAARQNYKAVNTEIPSSVSIGRRVVFTGKNDKLKCEVIIDGKPVMLQPRPYAYLQKLWAARGNGSPWVPKEALDISPYQSKYISKLNSLLAKSGIDMRVISNGRGAYSLNIQ